MNLASPTSRRVVLGGALGAFAWWAIGRDGFPTLTALPGGGDHSFGGLSMGTSYTVKIRAPKLSDAALEAAHGAVDAALAKVVARMSHYDSDSELSRLNHQPLGRALPVSDALQQVLQAAQAVQLASAGAFDVTLGEAVDAWGFGPGKPTQRIPGQSRLQALRRAPGKNPLHLDAQAGTVIRLAPVSVNLSGIAKGFGVDQAARALERLDIGDYMIELGGEIRTRGRNAQGRPWQLAIELPDAMPQRALRVLPLDGKALATSGDYRNYFMHAGRRYTHEIDPASGAPVQHALASVSVVADDCMQADAWSTALFVLGPERGYAVAQQQGLAAHFVVRDGGRGLRERQTPAFRSESVV